MENSFKALSLAALMLVTVSGNIKSDNKDSNPKSDDKRVELKLKQRHSGIVPQTNLYADGIKIKRDISILKQLQEEQIMDEWEVPADDIYQGVWANTGVRSAYTTIEKEIPDSFRVDLGNFTMPTTYTDLGHITSKFGPRRWRMHYGLDLKVNTGDTICAAFDGKVRVKQYERRGYGYYLVLRHANGLETVYGHLSGFLVEEEQIVKSGEPIALGGNTGRSSGAHLHFEFRFLGKAIDPQLIVDFTNNVTHRDHFTIKKNMLSDPRNIYTAKGGNVRYHRIKSGDTLGGLARKYRTSVNVLRAMNGMSTKSILRIGKALKVPPAA